MLIIRPGLLPVFETDSNGFLLLRRVLNKTRWARNEDYFHVTRHPVAGNYYPLSGAAGTVRISDSAIPVEAAADVSASPGQFVQSVALLTDTAHGATAQHPGELVRR